MENLFGIDMTTIAWVMSGLFAGVVLIVIALALKNRVLFAMGARNLPRRKQETILIILGLMLATMITSAAFGTGDTITHSIRTSAVNSLGEIDLVIQAPLSDATETDDFFAESQAQAIKDELTGQDIVESVIPAIVIDAPLVSPSARLSVPSAEFAGISPDDAAAFSIPRDAVTEELLDLSDLAPGEVYLSDGAADELNAVAGDRLDLYTDVTPTTLTVKGIHEDDGTDLYFALDHLQGLIGRDGEVNRVFISNVGGPVEGAEHSDAVEALIIPLLEGTTLEVEPIKKDVLEIADTAGSAFVSIFVLFGLFSIAAGMLLIFLIFVMLAAERKPEMGMARAVGMQRRHLVQTFLMEGAIYDLIAAAVGAALGILVSLALVRVMAVAFGQGGAGDDFMITFRIEPRSVLVAYTVGMVLTFIVVTISAWRVSVLNIVRAIRDLPEPRLSRHSRRALIFSVLAIVLGVVMTWHGFSQETLFTFMGGVSLVIIGGGLVLRRFGAPDRAVYTIAGVGLLVWWLLPADVFELVLPDIEFSQGIEIFFLSGIMLVAGAVWTLMYNVDVLIGVIIRILRSSRSLAPILKMAASFPLYSRFRTGLTLAMFALVVFTMIFMAVIIDVNSVIFAQRDRITGGADISANVSLNNPIPDLRTAIDASPDLNPNDYLRIGGVSFMPAQFRLADTDDEQSRWGLRGADDDYITGRDLGMRIIAEGYADSDAVWDAVRTTPGMAVVDSSVVPSRNNFSVNIGGTEFRLEGVFLEDETMQPIRVEVADYSTGRTMTMTVIGVIDDLSFFTFGMYVSQQTMTQLTPTAPPPTQFFMETPESTDDESAAKALESAFLEHGMQTQVLDDVIEEQQASNRTINSLFQGFMGLGLLVGIAALGVISARAVVERRRQIGALRAIGFRRGMVQMTFLLESSFIAMLGILLGVALGLALSIQVTGYIVEDLGVQGASFNIPWLTVALIIVIAYVASLLTTAYPAWQASRVYPSEALRYE